MTNIPISNGKICFDCNYFKGNVFYEEYAKTPSEGPLFTSSIKSHVNRQYDLLNENNISLTLKSNFFAISSILTKITFYFYRKSKDVPFNDTSHE